MPHPRIRSVASVFPGHRAPQDLITAEIANRWHDRHASVVKRLRQFHMNVGVKERALALPPEAYRELKGFGMRGKAWAEVATDLGEQALRNALLEAQWEAGNLNAIYFTSITGVSAPSIEARLVQRLGLSRNIKRTPIFGLGCAAGAMGLTRAHDYLVGFPGERAALLSVELCSLTFQPDDASPANMIATGLFGDGAACVLLEGPRSSHAGGAEVGSGGRRNTPRIVATRSILFENTESIMGWKLSDEGFQIELSGDLPALVHAKLAHEVDTFLEEYGRKRADIASYVAHPGGPKILQSIQEALDLSPADLEPSWRCLERHGNLSSASVLVVLEDWMKRVQPPAGSHGLLFAMGPGFALELVLLQW